jgi:transaldolase
VQAAAAAEAGASYIAPYVGRVTDWKGEEADGDSVGGVERGVQLARDAQLLYRAKGWTTKVR